MDRRRPGLTAVPDDVRVVRAAVQIYLSERETAALDRAAKATSRTRSHLIREAIAERYLRRPHVDDLERALRETAGAWANRDEAGAEVVNRLRSGRLARMHRRA